MYVKDGIKIINEVCPKCKHPAMKHIKTSYRNEQRQTIPSTKSVYSECKQCRTEGKKCEYYIKSK
jgi:hypothetical protein